VLSAGPLAENFPQRRAIYKRNTLIALALWYMRNAIKQRATSIDNLRVRSRTGGGLGSGGWLLRRSHAARAWLAATAGVAEGRR
jgi:hypothetical protein